MKVQRNPIIALLLLALGGCNFFSTSNSASTLVGESTIRAKAVAAGYMHACALSPDGDIYCWGDNSSGQLGAPFPGMSTGGGSSYLARAVSDPDPSDRWVQVEVAMVRSCGIKASGRVYCWGANQYYEIGHSLTDAAPVLTPREIFWFERISASDYRLRSFNNPNAKLVMGDYTTCVYTPGATEYICWGYVGNPNDNSFVEWQNSPATPWSECLVLGLCKDSGNYYSLPRKSKFMNNGRPIVNLTIMASSPCMTYRETSTQTLARCKGDFYTITPSATHEVSLSLNSYLVPLFYKQHDVDGPGDVRYDTRCTYSANAAIKNHRCHFYGIMDADGRPDKILTLNMWFDGGNNVASKTMTDPRKGWSLGQHSLHQAWGQYLYSYFSCMLDSQRDLRCSSTSVTSFTPVYVDDSNANFSKDLIVDGWFLAPPNGDLTHAAAVGTTSFARPIKQYALGYAFACAVLDDGRVQCLGYNNQGQSGLSLEHSEAPLTFIEANTTQ